MKRTLPPRMHLKNGVYYYVTSTRPRKWIKLHDDLVQARVLWAQIENGGMSSGFVARLDEYLLSPAYLELAKKTRQQYESVAKQLREFFKGATIDVITPPHIAAWMDNHYSKIQANTGLAMLRNVFDVAVRYGAVERNIAKAIPYHRITGRDRLITDQEYLAIWNEAEQHVRIAMDIGYLTGSRIQDILDIRLQDVTDEGLFIKQGKTGKKILFLRCQALDDVIALAKSLPRPIRGMHLICNHQGSPYPYGTFNNHWLAAVRAVGIKNIHFHDIRAKAATDAKAQGLDYQGLLGHASKAMSDRYVKLREVARVETLQFRVK